MADKIKLWVREALLQWNRMDNLDKIDFIEEEMCSDFQDGKTVFIGRYIIESEEYEEGYKPHNN